MADKATKKRIGRPRKKPGDPKSPYTMTVKTLEQRQIKPMDGEDAEYNSRLIHHALEIAAIAPPRTGRGHTDDDVPVLTDSLLKYFQVCEKNGIRPGSMGACCAMGIDHDTLMSWTRDKNRARLKEFAITVVHTMSAIREGMISAGKLNPVIGIFWQRNFDGLRNDTEQVQAAQQADDNGGYDTVSEIKKRYGDLLKE